jgi:hypothetical protein
MAIQVTLFVNVLPKADVKAKFYLNFNAHKNTSPKPEYTWNPTEQGTMISAPGQEHRRANHEAITGQAATVSGRLTVTMAQEQTHIRCNPPWERWRVTHIPLICAPSHCPPREHDAGEAPDDNCGIYIPTKSMCRVYFWTTHVKGRRS